MSSYHHGSLRTDLLAAAAKAVESEGVAAVSLRRLARELGVTHAAPRYHFGDKRGVITALAAEGYSLLAARLGAVGDDFLEAGVAYVRFALEYPGHFAVMYQAELVNEGDADLIKARATTRAALLAVTPARTREAGGNRAGDQENEFMPPLALLGWAAAHGLAQLASIGALGPAAPSQSVEALTELARRTLRQLGSS